MPDRSKHVHKPHFRSTSAQLLDPSSYGYGPKMGAAPAQTTAEFVSCRSRDNRGGHALLPSSSAAHAPSSPSPPRTEIVKKSCVIICNSGAGHTDGLTDGRAGARRGWKQGPAAAVRAAPVWRVAERDEVSFG